MDTLEQVVLFLNFYFIKKIKLNNNRANTYYFLIFIL